MKLHLTHLYPRRMNIYGDRGNILTLTRRAEWRGIEVTVTEVEVGDPLPKQTNLFFFGGGQDQEQVTVAADLQKKGTAIRKAIENGAALLSVCGGYQLLGEYYQPDNDDRIEGIGVFPIHTEGGPKRLIGNVTLKPSIDGLTDQLVGFENHSGQTWLNEGTQPLGRVVSGFGNNGQDGNEGCVVGKTVGTYLHGSLLPKNPQLADWLLSHALETDLAPLDDSLEHKANQLAAELR